MSVIYWIIFGLVAGTIANFIAPNPQEGLLGSMVLGIVGAIVGGYLGERLVGVGISGFNVKSMIVAVLGALLVLFVSRLLLRG